MAYNGEPKAVFPDTIRFSSLRNPVGSRETSTKHNCESNKTTASDSRRHTAWRWVLAKNWIKKCSIAARTWRTSKGISALETGTVPKAPQSRTRIYRANASENETGLYLLAIAIACDAGIGKMARAVLHRRRKTHSQDTCRSAYRADRPCNMVYGRWVLRPGAKTQFYLPRARNARRGRYRTRCN